MNDKCRYLYCNLMGYVFIPNRIKNIKERKILHISDTPQVFFNVLQKLLKELSPHIIIHTGDMVDNIKLEIYNNQLCLYERHLKSIMAILESSSAEKIYIAAGNHDNLELINRYSKRSTIIEGSSKIQLFNGMATISHYPEKILEDPSDYNFFGHDISLNNDIINNKVYLNGISSINIITEETGKIFCLPYPYGIDNARLSKRKIGL